MGDVATQGVEKDGVKQDETAHRGFSIREPRMLIEGQERDGKGLTIEESDRFIEKINKSKLVLGDGRKVTDRDKVKRKKWPRSFFTKD